VSKAIVSPRSGQAMVPGAQELINQSIRSTPWMMLAMLIGVPAGLLTQVLIGRSLGSAGLGIYSLVLLAISTIQTFLLFGGSNVIVNFIPRATARQKTAFLRAYLDIAVGFAGVFLIVLMIFPMLLRAIVPGWNGDAHLLLLFLGIGLPIVIGQTLVLAILQGEMELAAAARTQYGVQMLGCILAILMSVFVVPHHWFASWQIIPLIVLGAYLGALVGGCAALVRVMRHRWRWSPRRQLPDGFWKFTTTFHMHSIVTFFFANCDQLIIVWRITDVGQVGIFRAALVVATYLFWMPNLLTGAMYPLFTNLHARHISTALVAAYQRYSVITALIVAGGALLIGLVAPVIIPIFGHDFSSMSVELLQIFALMYALVASAAYVPTAALITAHEDIWINLLMNLLALGLRLAFIVVFLTRGLQGIALADLLSLVALHLGTLFIVAWRYHVKLPRRQHVLSLLTGALLLVAYHWWSVSLPIYVIWSVLSLGLFTIFVARSRLVRHSDMLLVARHIPILRHRSAFAAE
jgi:O-antigen/teichoic acid export membrane protein